MIDPTEPLEVQVERQARIIDALLRRSAREEDVGNSSYSLFQSAISLQGELWSKTQDLEQALATLGKASDDLKLSEVERRKSQSNLADALEAMEDGFALFSDDRLQICNDKFKRLLPDVARAIVPGMTLERYFHKLRISRFVFRTEEMERHYTSLQDSETIQTDQSFVLGVTGDRWFQISYRATSSQNTVVLQTEITHIIRQNRLEKDQLISRHSRFLDAAFDHMSVGICTFSDAGTLLIRNQRFGELLGLPVRMMHKGMALVQILDYLQNNNLVSGMQAPFDRTALFAAMGRAGELKARLRHARGDVLDFHMYSLPDGGFIANVMDITAQYLSAEALERRVAERTLELTSANERLTGQNAKLENVQSALRTAKEEAEAAVSSKTRFLAAASHDLLQPINAAKLYLSTLTETARGTALADTIDRLDRSFESIETLLHALLDISRLESTGAEFNISEFAISDIMSTIEADFTGLAAEKSLRLRVVPCRYWVRSDHSYLQRILQNLVVNAIEYTDEGEVLIGCRRRGDHIRVEVWDTGIGISKQDQTRIFDAFTRVQTTTTTSGMGLGLSIVDQACRHLGHAVKLRSQPGKGSVFSIDLPMVEARALPHEDLQEDHQADETEMDVIVVIVENDAEVLHATAQRLEAWGASVLAASSTAEAVDLVASIGMAPDIILADYQLDDDDTGVAAIDTLRRTCDLHIPAIMITASRNPELTEISRSKDFIILTKPVQLSRLRPLIDWKVQHARQEIVAMTNLKQRA